MSVNIEYNRKCKDCFKISDKLSYNENLKKYM